MIVSVSNSYPSYFNGFCNRLSSSPTTPQAAVCMRLGHQLERYCEMTVSRNDGTTLGAFFAPTCVLCLELRLESNNCG